MPEPATRKSARTRRDPRADRAVEAILDAAEVLIGQHGIDGVTFRQIRDRIGSSNRNFVQYHVGDMPQVVQAIFARRLVQMESRRADLLALAEANGSPLQVRSLLEIIYRPIAEIVDDQGQRVYAAFLCGLLVSNSMALRYELDETAPVSARLFHMLEDVMPSELAGRYQTRTMVVAQMIVGVLGRRGMRDPLSDDETALQELLDMAAAAFLAQPENLKTDS